MVNGLAADVSNFIKGLACLFKFCEHTSLFILIL